MSSCVVLFVAVVAVVVVVVVVVLQQYYYIVTHTGLNCCCIGLEKTYIEGKEIGATTANNTTQTTQLKQGNLFHCENGRTKRVHASA